MKRLIIPLIVIFSCSSASAQFYYGVKAGVNRNDVRGDRDPVTHNSSTGFHIGVFGSILLNERFSLNPELQYIRKQSEIYGVLNYNYIEIPVLLNYHLMHRLSIGIGPALGRRVIKRTMKTLVLSSGSDNLDLSLAGGATFKVSDRIALAARYNYSISPFEKLQFNNGSGVAAETYTLYNSNAQISVMCKIN